MLKSLCVDDTKQRSGVSKRNQEELCLLNAHLNLNALVLHARMKLVFIAVSSHAVLPAKMLPGLTM